MDSFLHQVFDKTKDLIFDFVLIGIGKWLLKKITPIAKQGWTIILFLYLMLRYVLDKGGLLKMRADVKENIEMTLAVFTLIAVIIHLIKNYQPKPTQTT